MQDYNGIFEEYIQTKNQLVQQEALLSTLSSHAKFTQTLIQSINNSIQKYSYPQNHTLFKPLSNIITKFNDESNQSISRITGGIINPIEEFQQNTSVINTTELKDFNQLCSNLISSKQSLSKVQSNYYSSCTKYNEIQSMINNNNKKTHSQQEQDLLIKAKTQKENKAQLYRYEIEKFNKTLTKANQTYSTIQSLLKAKNITNNSIMKAFLLTYFNIITNLSKLPTLIASALNEMITSLANELHNSSNNNNKVVVNNNNNNRFPFEVFVPFNDTTSIKDVNDVTPNQNTNASLVNEDDEFEIITKDDYEDEMLSLISNEPNKKEKIYKDKIIIIKQLLIKNKTQILPDDISFIMKYFNIDKDDKVIRLEEVLYFNKWFFDIYNKNVYIVNYQNFEHFCNVINTVYIKINDRKIINDKDKKFVINGNRAIIEISEKVCSNYYKNNNYIYMCSVLSEKNKTFSSTTFWIKLVKGQIINEVNYFIKMKLPHIKENNFNLEKVLKDNKHNINVGIRFDDNEKSNTNNNKLKKIALTASIVFTGVKEGVELLKSVKSVFIPSKDMNNNRDEYVLEMNSFCNECDGYNKLTTFHKNVLDSYAKQLLRDIIIEYIQHMVNFNLDKTSIESFINFFTLDLTLFQTDAKYFFSLVYLQGHSLKKISNLKSSPHIHNSFIINNITHNKSIVTILKHVYPYINKYRTSLHLLTLNKTITHKLRPLMLTRYIQSKSYSYLTHVSSWYHKLNINLIKLNQTYNYNFTKGIFNISILSSKTKDTIDLDVSRTSFTSNEKENRKKLTSILYYLAMHFPDINYCQGMSYTVSFLLQLLNYNESDTYYYMVGLMLYTQYSSLYPNDLRTLKIYFFTCDKILSLFFPEIYDKFLSSKLASHFFMTPWFLTLFTNGFMHLNHNNIPKSMMLILDNFIYQGYDAILFTGLTILDYHRQYILELDQDDCFDFLVNRLNQSDILKNEKIDLFIYHLNRVVNLVPYEVLLNIKGIFEYEYVE